MWQAKVHNHLFQPVGVGIDFSDTVSLEGQEVKALCISCILGFASDSLQRTMLKSFVKAYRKKPLHVLAGKSFCLDNEIPAIPK